jgi:hypothetical protein
MKIGKGSSFSVGSIRSGAGLGLILVRGAKLCGLDLLAIPNVIQIFKNLNVRAELVPGITAEDDELHLYGPYSFTSEQLYNASGLTAEAKVAVLVDKRARDEALEAARTRHQLAMTQLELRSTKFARDPAVGVDSENLRDWSSRVSAQIFGREWWILDEFISDEYWARVKTIMDEKSDRSKLELAQRRIISFSYRARFQSEPAGVQINLGRAAPAEPAGLQISLGHAAPVTCKVEAQPKNPIHILVRPNLAAAPLLNQEDESREKILIFEEKMRDKLIGLEMSMRPSC